MQPSERRRAHRCKTRRITGILLAVWFSVSFAIGYFARNLDVGSFGWPFGFWAAAQGALVVYVLVIRLYEGCMKRLARDFGEAEDE